MMSKGEPVKPVTPPATAPVKPERAETPCVIGIGVTVVGKITSSGFVQIEGHVEGEVCASTLVINGTACIKGDVFADSILVRGKIAGNVRGRDVQLRSTGHVEGAIFHQLLAVETGAVFEGKSCPSQDPMGKAKQLLEAKANTASETPVIAPAREHPAVQAA